MTKYDRRGFPEALTAEREWVRRLALAVSMHPGEAEDLEQETWLAALTGRRPRGPLRAWLASVLRSSEKQRRRGALRRKDHEARIEAPGDPVATDEILSRMELQRHIAETVRALEEPYRTTVLLRFYEGLAPADIARQTGVPVATVKTRLRRGLERLRRELRECKDSPADLAVLAGGGDARFFESEHTRGCPHEEVRRCDGDRWASDRLLASAELHELVDAGGVHRGQRRRCRKDPIDSD